MAIPTSRTSGAIDIQLRALNSGGVMTDSYPITVVEDVIGIESKIRTEIASAGSIKFEVVASRPATGELNVIYLVPAEGTLPEQNIYDEYIWMAASGTQSAHWEIIGTTQTDVSNKMNKSGTYTNNHILLGLAGGTAIDGGKYLGSNTFNGTSSNYMAREDGVVNYVSAKLSSAFGAQTLTGSAPIVVSGGTVSITSASVGTASSGAVILSGAVANVTTAAITPAGVSAALNGTSDHVVAYSAGGKLKDTGKIVGGATFATTPVSTTLATELGVSKFVAAYVSASAITDLPLAGYTAASSGLMYVVSSGGALTITSGGLNIQTASVVGDTDNTGLGVVALDVTADYNGLYITNGALNLHSATVGGLGTIAAAEYDSTMRIWSSTASPAAPEQSSFELYMSDTLRAPVDTTNHTYPTWVADSNAWGVVKIGSNINVTASGVISVSSAAAGANPTAGVVKLYNAVNTSTNGAVTPLAVSSAISAAISGATHISGAAPISTNITASGGTISIAMATTSTSGAVVLNNTPSASGGVAATPQLVSSAIRYASYAATSSVFGVVKIQSAGNITVTNGVIDVPTAYSQYTNPSEPWSQKPGVVNITSNMSAVAAAGQDHTVVPDVATTIDYVSSAISAATNITGVAPISANITAAGGTISIKDGSTSSKGAVKLTNTIDATSANALTPGAVYSNCIFYSIV